MEKTYGPDHAEVAEFLDDLAGVYRAAERIQEAEEVEGRAARIRAIKR
jgi:hypothetical protein